MTTSGYQYVGEVQPGRQGDQLLAQYGLDTGPTAIYTCGTCGVLVAEGAGQRIHDTWHDTLTSK